MKILSTVEKAVVTIAGFDTLGSGLTFVFTDQPPYNEPPPFRGSRTDRLIEIIRAEKPDAVLAHVDDYNDDVQQALQNSNPKFKGIFRSGTGYIPANIATANKLGILYTITAGSNAKTVAEHALALLLAGMRRIPEHATLMHNLEWKRFKGHDLTEKKWLLVGLGENGLEMAFRAVVSNARLTILHPSLWGGPRQAAAQERLKRVRELADVLRRPESVSIVESEGDIDAALSNADIVTLHMNEGPSSTNWLSAHRIGLLKKGVFVVNVGRGSFVDEVALADAVALRQVNYCADVFQDETPARVGENPFVSAHRAVMASGKPIQFDEGGVTVLTPHIAPFTNPTGNNQVAQALRNIRYYVLGDGAEPREGTVLTQE